MADTLFTNVRIFDGTGALPYAGEVLVRGNRIRGVAKGARTLPVTGATVIDAGGATLMPGLTESHTHFAWNDQPSLGAIQKMPVEEHILWCAHVAERYLSRGFTSCVGAATAKARLDVVIRNAIESGQIPGPRYLAASQEITVPGGLGDESPPHLPYPEFSFGAVVSGADEMRKCVRMFLKYGVDTIKLNLSGEYIAGLPAEATPMTEAEIATAVEEVRKRGKRLAAHARSCESVKQCVRHGIELVYHASFTDEEALDMLEENKEKHFVAPGIAWLINTSYHASQWGITPEVAKNMGYHRELEVAIESLKKMHKRGIRILPGGDYGFAWIEHGTNAKDLEYFVKYLGFTPMEALLAATKLGGEIMMRPDELGQVRDGFLADLLLVDGDPLANIAVLQEPARILAVMKDGVFHKEPEVLSARSRWSLSAA
ncbi:MAG: amidohydrolase family protein [Burkholderiaceae bacterium]|jgi:imidazolonepropionase-like amidohydrolase|nr:amidohydrolase family protein [Burkholderiales bacterium]MCZ8108229.1 amidohydrolase family protein [Burkholderiales bacterium]MCZ8338661.1 amidohydrolase family protein [Burkholderiaceae bacterium]